MINKHFEYEKLVIDPILDSIRKNQEYLTQKENLPQLAKLGYMYNTLWYAGRLCWGSWGVLRGDAIRIISDEERKEFDIPDDEEGCYYDCENNPKYKIEECEALNDEIENLIYDAWGMHVSNETPVYFEDFYNLIKKGKELNDFDRKLLKTDKTFDDWLEILTDERYPYQHENKKSVSNRILCSRMGGEFDVSENGFIYQIASGAKQNREIYKDWENAIFRDDIQKVVDVILSYPEVKETMDTDGEKKQIRFDEEKKKKDDDDKQNYKTLEKNGFWTKEEGKLHRNEMYRRLDDVWDSIAEKLGKSAIPFTPIKKGYETYYPIEDESIMERIFQDGVVHESYKKEAIYVCEDILQNEIEESKHRLWGKQNIAFAKKFINKYKNGI